MSFYNLVRLLVKHLLARVSKRSVVYRLIFCILTLLLSTFSLAAKAEHQYCVVPDRSDLERRICISGGKGLDAVLSTAFGYQPSELPLKLAGLPSLFESDKMVLIYPEPDNGDTHTAMTVYSTPLDPRWLVAVDRCDEGDQNACAQQGGMMIQKGHSAPRDVYTAQLILTRSCDSNVAQACHFLGQISFYGLMGEKNLDDGVSNFEKACTLGHADSCLRLGYGFTGRYLEIPEDVTQAAAYYESACDLVEMSACNELGYAYAKAEGVEFDKPKAASLWKKACDANEMIACFNYGDLVQNGSTVENRDALALTYYQLSCDLGFEKACARLTN